jgi:putative hydrolase of the HAD superfamily
MVLYQDVIPALTEIKNKGLISGLISNVDKDVTTMLQKLQIKSLLDVVITSQDVGFTKPNPEIFKAATKKAGIEASEAIYIGDQYKIDVVGANNAGLSGVLLDRADYYRNDGYKRAENQKLTPGCRTFIINDQVKFLTYKGLTLC